MLPSVNTIRVAISINCKTFLTANICPHSFISGRYSLVCTISRLQFESYWVYRYTEIPTRTSFTSLSILLYFAYFLSLLEWIACQLPTYYITDYVRLIEWIINSIECFRSIDCVLPPEISPNRITTLHTQLYDERATFCRSCVLVVFGNKHDEISKAGYLITPQTKMLNSAFFIQRPLTFKDNFSS